MGRKKKGGDLYTHLRSKGKIYRKRGASKDKRAQIINRVGIENPPEIVDKKERLGDAEMDLVIEKDHKQALLTINDRSTGMLKMAIVDSKDSEVIQKKAVEILQEWKLFLKTITSEKGK